MKVHVIGGGPAGLYFAILMKKAWPQTRITVFERNRPDDTFGFGVVFSDETLETSRTTTARATARSPATSPTGTTSRSISSGTMHRIGGNGFCGCSRATLLKMLQDARPRARRRAEIPDRGRSATPTIRDADLVVAADGINSRIRESFKDAVQAEHRPAAQQVRLDGLDAAVRRLHFFFSETEHGIFIAHCYQYEPGRSTWVMETDPETFARAGLDKLDEAAVGALPRRRVRRGARRPQADHQPLALAQLPDHPLRALDRTTTSC